MENRNQKRQPTENEVRLYIRKIVIEHYAKNGLGNLSSQEVQRRLLVIEAKAKKHISTRAKLDNKLNGSKKSIGNSMSNSKWLLGRPKKGKEIKGTVGGSKMTGLKTHQMSPGVAKFGVSKPGGKEIKDSMSRTEKK